MKSVALPAYAKVNLFLDVLGKRLDGYHELLTLFERISLADELTFTQASGAGITLESDSPEIPLDGTNLVVRAAQAYRRLSGESGGVAIRLRKRIPVGGGLGGGSSDAAATLRALQQLNGGVVSEPDLMACARGLGADVAFFASQTARALGRDRGDRIEPIPAGQRLFHLLVTPDFPIPTQEVYSALVPPSRNPDIAPILQALSSGQAPRVRSFLYNALEPTVEQLYPKIRRVKSEMESAGLEKPMVSGSGSTVFALCDSEAQARSSAEVLRKKQPSWRVNVASTL